MSSITTLPISILAIPAFTDNYLWLVTRGSHAAVIDPGDAGPVEEALSRLQLTLDAIVLTHHHADHTGGVIPLQKARNQALPVFGPRDESIPGVNHPVSGGESILVPGIEMHLQVLDVPGHTRGHIAYVGKTSSAPLVFCGDTLFAAGCGRLFEGTPAQMFTSLGHLASLPPETKVYCAHEYTESNLRFAKVVEPENLALSQRIEEVRALRAEGLPSVPSTIGVELATNPFLRADNSQVRLSAEGQAKHPLPSSLEVFTALRAWKDNF